MKGSIIINELINIENREGVLLVGSREIAENFNKEHTSVIKSIVGENRGEKHIAGMIDNILESGFPLSKYFIESTYENRGKQYPEYFFTRTGFSLLVMGFTGKEAFEWKLKYIDAFDKMETALREQNAKLLPATYKEALQQLLVQVEENEKLLAENNVLTPKANYHDEVLKKPNLISVSVIAKDMGFSSATKLNELMFKNKIIFREGGVWKPYAKYEWLIKDGYADYESYNVINSNPLLKWTEKGRKWIVDSYPIWEQL